MLRHQALTRFSISRKSREEMVHFFLSRAGELNFHFSRCSRMSRFWRKNSRSPLEIRDFEKNLFHFSKEWDFANRFSFSSRFFTQCLFQFSWEIIFCSLGWFWPSVFCRKGKYFKKTVVEQYSDISFQKHFMETTTTKSHLWEYFEWLPSGKSICKTCKNEIVDWLGWRVRTRGGGEEIEFFIIFDIGYNKMDNYCTDRLMIIALW